jgi:hypothetical protein
MGINLAWFTSATEAVNSCKDCGTLDRVSSQYQGAVSSQVADMTAQISTLGALITAPTDLPSVITWITNYISLLSGPYGTLLTELSATEAQQTLLNAAITAKKAELGC